MCTHEPRECICAACLPECDKRCLNEFFAPPPPKHTPATPPKDKPVYPFREYQGDF